MKLSEGNVGEEYIIGKMELDAHTMHRLEMLGMTIGTRLSVLGKKRGGPMIIKVRGTRFAVGRRFTKGVEVAVV